MRLFGTDGIRGEVGKYPLTAENILKLAKAASLVLKKKNSISRVVINKDTRLSGYIFEPALTAGFISMGVNVVSLTEDQIKSSKRTKLIIPAGTYAGHDSDIATTSLPVVAYATTNMSDDVAYNLTKAYWENKGKLGEAAKWWNGVTTKMLSNVSTKIHSGAIKYYQEIGVKLANHHK